MSTEMQTIQAPRIGAHWPEEGGVYAGIVRGENGKPDYHLIVPTHASAAFKNVAWGKRGQKVEGADSDRDGHANTHAMAEAGSQLACDILALEIDGHSDLYLMARHEARLCYLNVPELFETDDWYWTSTQYSSYRAWFQDFNNGGQDHDVKGYQHRARAVRRREI